VGAPLGCSSGSQPAYKEPWGGGSLIPECLEQAKMMQLSLTLDIHGLNPKP